MRNLGKKIAAMAEDQLLKMPLNRLSLPIERSEFVSRGIDQVRKDLHRKNIILEPRFWVGDEWFSPEGIDGVAIPFFLLHPRLTDMELKYTGEAEGHKFQELCRLLRHEIGHAIEHAFELADHPLREVYFGSTRLPYPKYYIPKPHSRNYVKHLPLHYAQSHPDEDFAETFAVWLTPGSKWRTKYKKWPVLQKLLAMDSMMKEIKGYQPTAQKRSIQPFRLSTVNMTLEKYYRRKNGLNDDCQPLVNKSLNRNSSIKRDPQRALSMSLNSQINELKPYLVSQVQRRTGEKRYLIEQMIQKFSRAVRSESSYKELSFSGSKKELASLMEHFAFDYLNEHHYREYL